MNGKGPADKCDASPDTVGKKTVEYDAPKGEVLRTESGNVAEEAAVDGQACIAATDQGSWKQMVFALDFQLLVLFFSMLQAIGSGLFFANLALMATSLRIPERERLRQVRWISYCNCLGRFVAGCAMDFFSRHGVPRIAHGCWTGTVFVCCVALLRFAPEAALADLLLPVVVVVGFAYGANWTIMPGYIADRFGTSYLGIGFNVNAAAMSCTVTAASQLFGYLYDVEAAVSESESAASDAGFCLGAKCWRGAYSFALGLACVGLVTGITMTWQSRKGQGLQRGTSGDKGSASQADAL